MSDVKQTAAERRGELVKTVLTAQANARRAYGSLNREVFEFSTAMQHGVTDMMDDARARAHAALDVYFDEMSAAHEAETRINPDV